MKKSILFFLFIIAGANLFSQKCPGYMGKRFLIGYGLHFSPALLGSNGSQASILGRGNASGGDIAFNSVHEGFIEYAFKNRASVVFSVKYYKTTFDNSISAYSTVYDGYGGSYSVDGTPTGFYDIKGLNYSLYFKIFNKRYVAPWGRYFMFGPSLNTYNCFYDPSSMQLKTYNYNTNSNITLNDFGPQGQSFMRPDILVGWGRTRVVANRITIDYGINFEIFALGMIIWDSVGESPFDIFTSTSITNLNYFEKTSKRRSREVNRINAFIKVGVLLF